jgi:hypothetical protein
MDTLSSDVWSHILEYVPRVDYAAVCITLSLINEDLHKICKYVTSIRLKCVDYFGIKFTTFDGKLLYMHTSGTNMKVNYPHGYLDNEISQVKHQIDLEMGRKALFEKTHDISGLIVCRNEKREKYQSMSADELRNVIASGRSTHDCDIEISNDFYDSDTDSDEILASCQSHGLQELNIDELRYMALTEDVEFMRLERLSTEYDGINRGIYVLTDTMNNLLIQDANRGLVFAAEIIISEIKIDNRPREAQNESDENAWSELAENFFKAAHCPDSFKATDIEGLSFRYLKWSRNRRQGYEIHRINTKYDLLTDTKETNFSKVFINYTITSVTGISEEDAQNILGCYMTGFPELLPTDFEIHYLTSSGRNSWVKQDRGLIISNFKTGICINTKDIMIFLVTKHGYKTVCMTIFGKCENFDKQLKRIYEGYMEYKDMF